MTKKHKAWYWILKVLSVIISCALPIYAVAEHFPIWSYSYGTVRSVGAGFVIILIVVAIIFRKAVFDFLKDKLKLNNAPPLAVWLICLIVAYVMLYINKFIQDLTTVLWMGLIGCAIGTLLTFIAEHCFNKKEEKDE